MSLFLLLPQVLHTHINLNSDCMAFERGSHPVTQLPCYSVHISGWFRSRGNPPEFWGCRHAPQTTALHSLFLHGGTHGWPALRCCFLCLLIYPETYLATASLLLLLLGSIRTHECPTVSCLAHLDTELIASPFRYKHPCLCSSRWACMWHACKDAGGINS